MPKYRQTEEILKLMENKEQIRNIGVIAHVDHGKTTMSDSLLMAAGIISPKVAGTALAMDYLEIEQKRQMTVKAANVSLLHERNGKSYVINLIDTPGHVDFTGKVTRSLRVMDGAVVVVDCVEGVMTQTETVVRQALEEKVKPVLYINKLDRLVKELRLSPQEVQNRLLQIIQDFNKLIEEYADPEYKEAWKVNPNKGQVAFGAAKDKWGFTLPMAKERGVKFSDVVTAYTTGSPDELVQKVPLYEAILDMVVDHLPSPVEAQKYRIPKIWQGSPDSPLTKSLLECDEKGPTVVAVNNVVVDPHAGLVATGRVFSGTVKTGDQLYLVNAGTTQTVLQVGLFMGQTREVADKIPAGNMVALLGLEQARAGETAIDPNYQKEGSFEKMAYISEPVVTVAIEPKSTSDLPKFIDTLHKMSIEDPNLQVKVREDTGEYLLSGMGQLHLEIALWDLQQRGFDVVTSPPLVVYRESIQANGGPAEGKSPNKHNRFYVAVEPLSERTLQLIQEGKVYDSQDFRERAKILREEAGWDADEARNIWTIDERMNIFVDRTKGLQHLREIKETIIQAFLWSTEAGPLAQEPMRGVKAVLVDALIHEDPAHRGPAQVMPAIKNAVMAAFLSANPTLLEPWQKVDIRVSTEYMAPLNRIINQKRGRVLEVIPSASGNNMQIIAEIPVAESFDLSNEIRSATAGKALWGAQFSHWAPVPPALLNDLIMKIRSRKGLPQVLPKPEDYIEA
ncbi:elongation factor EF-2 [Tardisphaera miroshnichenkoae]